MTDKNSVEAVSLVNMASMKKTGSDAKSDIRVRQMALRTASRGFDGFLQSFLGKGNASKSSSSFGRRDRTGSALSGKRSQSYGKYGSSRPGANLAASEKQALRRGMNKTAEDDKNVQADEDVAAAAEEAARLMSGLLFGGAMENGQNADSLKQVSGMLGGGGGGDLSGASVPGMTLDAWQEAMETANASAEMNNAATLSALDELLDGLPRGALEEALARTLGMSGASAGLFDQIASALDAQALSVGGGEAGMLAYLGGSSGQTAGGCQEEPGAAELFTDFLKETFPNGPINTTDSPDILDADNLLAAFEKWLQANGKPTGTALGLSGDVNKLVQSLASHLRGDTPASALPGDMAEFFSWAVAALEGKGGDSQTAAAVNAFASLFATADGARTLGEALSSDADAEGGRDGSAAAQVVQQQNQTAEAASNAPASSAASMSSMMDQIENIERLAEAMRLAAKGGVKNLTMQLTPDELGKVILKVEARDGVVSAYLRVEKPEAAAQLANNLQQLRENLKAQGIELGRLDIQTRGQNEALGDFGGGRQQRPGDRDADGGSGGRYSRKRDDGIEGIPSPIGGEPAGPGGPGELNLFA